MTLSNYILLLLIITIYSGESQQCSYSDSSTNLTWNLTRLSNLGANNYYTIPSTTATYYINFCENIKALPPSPCGISDSKVCVNDTGSTCTQNATRPAGTLTYGYANYSGGAGCYAIAGGSGESYLPSNASLITYSPYRDDTNSVIGLSILYSYGDYCVDPISGQVDNRQLEIRLVCTAANNGSIEQYANVAPSTVDVCTNIIIFNTIYGCSVNETTTNIANISTTSSSLNTTSLLNITTTGLSNINQTQQLNGTNTTNPTTTTISINTTIQQLDEDDYYSLFGSWCKSDMGDHEVFSVKIEVAVNCTEIKFNIVTPGNNTWFGFGLGGNYHFGSSSDEGDSDHIDVDTEYTPGPTITVSEPYALNMNGYAIIVIDIDNIFETQLIAETAPQPQGTQDLYCNGTEVNGIRYIECVREYITGDEAGNDFYEFIEGINEMIFAYGPIGVDGILYQHEVNEWNYGDAEISYIYLEGGDSLCGYAKDQAELSGGSGSGGSSQDEAWYIVGIVFVILFGLSLCVITYLVYKLMYAPKSGNGAGYGGKPQTKSGGYQQTHQTED